MSIKLKNGINAIRGFIVKNAPQILTGIGISGMIGSTVLAVKATPKALELLNDKREELNTDTLTFKETIATAWKPYIPAGTLCITSVACIISATTISTKRQTALATAYTLSERAFSTYKDKVIETIGEKKEKKIRDEIAQDRVNQDNGEKRQIIITPKGQTLCMDSISGRYFRSDLDTIRKVVNSLNREMTHQNYVSLNKFYSELGLPGIKEGDYIGWNIDRGLIELDFDACITDTDEPCIVIDYNITPDKGFDR